MDYNGGFSWGLKHCELYGRNPVTGKHHCIKTAYGPSKDWVWQGRLFRDYRKLPERMKRYDQKGGNSWIEFGKAARAANPGRSLTISEISSAYRLAAQKVGHPLPKKRAPKTRVQKLLKVKLIQDPDYEPVAVRKWENEIRYKGQHIPRGRILESESEGDY